jgi:uncharacterized RDD family membrane protein YckC
MTSADGSTTLVPGDLQARLFARAIDVLVLVAVDVALGWVIGFGARWLATGSTVVIGYFAMFDALAGATPGKMQMGLRVTSMTGGPPTLSQALLREAFTLLGAVPFLGPFLAIAAWIWIIKTIQADPLRRGKHDEMAGTRVVKV